MTLYKDSKLIYLSTKSQSGKILNLDPNDKSDMLYSVPNMYNLLEEYIEYVEFSIDNAIIPVSFYNITSTNNTIILELFAQSPYLASVTTYQIPIGNYTANSLISYFNTNFANFTLSLNSNSSIFTLTNQAQAFRFNSGTTADYIFGFSSTISSGAYDTVNFVATMTFTRPCNFLPLPRINIRCRELSNGRMISQVNSDELCLAIPNNNKLNSQILYNNLTNQKTLVKIESMNSFRLRITDDDGNLIKFNGISSYFTFRFDIYYKQPPRQPSFKYIVNLANINQHKKLLMQELLKNKY